VRDVSKIVESVKSYDTSQIISTLKNFIPEYSPDDKYKKLKNKKTFIVE
jgi:hypothetical protein